MIRFCASGACCKPGKKYTTSWLEDVLLGARGTVQVAVRFPKEVDGGGVSKV
jgi:hypothetical protein